MTSRVPTSFVPVAIASTRDSALGLEFGLELGLDEFELGLLTTGLSDGDPVGEVFTAIPVVLAVNGYDILFRAVRAGESVLLI